MIFGERPEVGLPDSRFAKPIQSEVVKRATDALPQNSGIRYRVCRTPWPTETTATPSSSSNAMYVSPPGSVSAEIQSARIAVRATVEDAELCLGSRALARPKKVLRLKKTAQFLSPARESC
jgi:hypothetical protein